MSAVLALLSSLLWGTADFLGGTATRRLPATTVVVVSQAVALVGLVPLALLTGAPASTGTVLPGVLAGVVGPAALVAFYRALALGTMGVVAPVAALGVAVPVIAGLAAGEAPSGLQLVGIAVAVAGVVLASGPELRGAGRGGAAPLVLALGAALGFGTVFVLLAEGSGGDGAGLADVVAVLLVMRLTSVLLLAAGLAIGAVAASRGAGPSAAVRADEGRADEGRADEGQVTAGPESGGPRGTGPADSGPASGGLRVRRSDLPVLAVVGAFDVGANGTFALASQSDLVSVTAVLASLYPVVTALLARQVHGERLRGVQIVGVAAAVLGVVLLAAG